MTDYFALLGEPRRPWLDSDSLKKKFLALSAETHPDKILSTDETVKAAATKKFAELNAAYNCLAEPKFRLLHLLELELGAKPKEIQQIPTVLADLFAEVAANCRNADNFLVEKAKTTSPLLQVQFFERAQEWIERLNSLQIKLNDLRGQLIDKLKSIDAKWMETNAESKRELLPQLEDIYRLLGYFNRWNNQIQERIVRLQL
ncbi:MAG TPA: J domain-containing protein [Verrucomicrobiae bacterium]|nr:J domain-containing protein [Verrucomicrobiae bacterium]